jgi:hypothetical protein
VARNRPLSITLMHTTARWMRSFTGNQLIQYDRFG